jgi:hypothetical protein
MRNFTNPLDNIHVASPCPANWNEMYGNERKRFCGDCKLNVYNLSDMTRQEAENLLLNSEGRLCVRFFRRADGTVLTKNCPIGWQAVKRLVSRVATAAFSVVIGFMSGLFALRTVDSAVSILPSGDVPPIKSADSVNPIEESVPVVGEIDTPTENEMPLQWVDGRVDLSDFRRAKKEESRKVLKYYVVGRVQDYGKEK